MIARPLPAPRKEPSGAHGWRTARNASAARRARHRVLRYRLIVRTVTGLCLATVAVLAYLALLANITRLNYSVVLEKGLRDTIVTQSLRDDVTIARLEARDKLESIAARLGMHEPEAFAVVSLPPRRRPAPSAPRGVAFLSGMAGWFK